MLIATAVVGAGVEPDEGCVAPLELVGADVLLVVVALALSMIVALGCVVDVSIILNNVRESSILVIDSMLV